ncbi:hypothetical protein BWQ96_10752 [Gracilariopsis chorda]|uniref:Uncharacterized protein n=1 Tax=Gracilariopsis chorda TaxID=448386 RepID=A0A2V3IBV2_9FLOR|nr:hypothetical protein BWQ96_10752 [Gracilariopsis chorda]|eukprot:PXF39551.1 hypothetical protein BWQ96_10752 [Gracilariopsis chorda]
MVGLLRFIKIVFRSFTQRKRIKPAVIIGRGRIGSLFNIKTAFTGWRWILNFFFKRDVVLGRHDFIPESYTGPIFCCVRADVIATRINACLQSKREDLIFMQNGHIAPILERTGVLSSCTRAVFYFRVPAVYELPTDGVTDKDPQGLTVVYGKWAKQVKNRLLYHNLSCNIVDSEQFEKSYYEKITWLSTFNLIGMYYGGLLMSVVANDKADEAKKMMHELFGVVQQRTSISFDVKDSVERLLSYSRTLTTFPTSFLEYESRNAFFYEHSKRVMARGETDPSPTHSFYLQALFQQQFKKPIPPANL